MYLSYNLETKSLLNRVLQQIINYSLQMIAYSANTNKHTSDLNYSGKPDVFQNLSGSGRLFNYFRTLLRRYDDRNAFLNLFIQPLSSWMKRINILRPQKRSCTRFGIPWFLLDKRCTSSLFVQEVQSWCTTCYSLFYRHLVISDVFLIQPLECW